MASIPVNNATHQQLLLNDVRGGLKLTELASLRASPYWTA